jgi:hypothetical protein
MEPNYPRVELGGVPIVIDSGAPDQSSDPIFGESIVRMGEGGGVKLNHWGKASGSISGEGLFSSGLDGLDFTGPLLLKLTMPECISDAGRVIPLTSTPRDDVAPWAYAMVDGELVRSPCVLAGQVVTVDAVAGAERYLVEWMPMFTVFASKPPKSFSHGARRYSWQIDWEEV